MILSKKDAANVIQYFSENPDEIKLKKNHTYRLHDGTEINILHSILKTTGTTGKIAYYEFDKTLGQGAYGIVKLARDISTGEAVAIKVQHAYEKGETEQANFATNLKNEEAFMADPMVNLLLGGQVREGGAREFSGSDYQKGENVKKYYSVQKLLKGADLSDLIARVADVDTGGTESIMRAETSAAPILSVNKEVSEKIEALESSENDPDYSTTVFNTAVYNTAIYSTFQAATMQAGVDTTKLAVPSSFMALLSGGVKGERKVEATDLVKAIATEDLLSLHRMFKNITTNLAAIHAANILHLDIKPENIKLDPETLDVTIFDFGVSKRLEPDQVKIITAEAAGTPYFMAPETKGFGSMPEFSDKADIFSLGKSFKQIIESKFMAGKLLALAFEFNNPDGLLNTSILNESAKLIGRMLSAEPEERPNALAVLKRINDIEDLLLTQTARLILTEVNESTIAQALHIQMMSKGACLSPTEAVKFIRQASGKDSKALREQVKAISSTMGNFSDLSIVQQIQSEASKLDSLKDEIVSVEDPYYVMQKSKNFSTAFDALKAQKPNLSKGEAVEFARKCTKSKLCDRRTAQVVLSKSGYI
tara:strand:+ start:55349 stop:57127 length:1779 start_codon:yes stop_codon:yes gene_type:complete